MGMVKILSNIKEQMAFIVGILLLGLGITLGFLTGEWWLLLLFGIAAILSVLAWWIEQPIKHT
jgi:hypothetical protein